MTGAERRSIGSSERIVLGRRDESTMVGFQWTGAEPEGLNDPDLAIALGARWEADELVSYDVPALRHHFEHFEDGFMEDPD